MAANKVVYGTLVLMDLTSDTVTADDLAKGVTCHDKSGNPITGTLPTSGDVDIVKTGLEYVGKNITIPGIGTSKIYYVDVSGTASAKNNRFILNKDAKNPVTVSIPATEFGDATANDVMSGKTFTSSKGLKKTGTYTPSSANRECYFIESPSNLGISFESKFGNILVYGYGQDENNIYAFYGSKYSYMKRGSTTITTTSARYNVVNGKLSGLPSGLTSCKLIVSRAV